MACRQQRSLGGRTALAALAALACALPTHAATDFPLLELAPGVFVHLGKPLALEAAGHDDIANLGFIIGSRCVAVIDTGGSVRIGRALSGAIKERTALPVCYVINTHVHVDHVLGNAAFKAPATRFVGHAQLAAALAQSRDFFLKNYGGDLDAPASPQQIIGPDTSVALATDLDLDLGARHLHLRAWPKAHTDCDLTIFDDATATLWTGDLLFVQRTPAIDGSIKGWLAVLDRIGAVPAKHVVPGHGPVSGDLRGALDPQRQYLQALLVAVRQEIADGKPLQTAIKEVQPQRSGWLLWDETHPRNVARVYQELEWE
jgi:quinoprotein relay system zinc metallohydrolase 2